MNRLVPDVAGARAPLADLYDPSDTKNAVLDERLDVHRLGRPLKTPIASEREFAVPDLANAAGSGLIIRAVSGNSTVTSTVAQNRRLNTRQNGEPCVNSSIARSTRPSSRAVCITLSW